ncbi:uncharacterized protein LOC127246569 [Andrographis paniculata]|uniref:uncharacterized protein LOC127246569 n=1 Tax=Andrographis paniculata TaxID=175694 RepID=UPI0021E92BE3|nr:uncharacterized protein LOC127246569 [Andrographis paniculata]
MENLHIRSNSFPSKSHPVINDVEDQLCRLKSSEGTSTSAASVCTNLANLRDLHEGVNNMIQMPSFQQALSAEGSEKWTSELLEESLRLMDLCGFAKDVLSLSKGSIQELQSTLRRKRGEAATADAIEAFMISRKKINKMVKKYIKNFNRSNTSYMGEDFDLRAILVILKETGDLDFSILKSALKFLSGEEASSKKRSWSFFSMVTQSSQIKSMDSVDMQNLKSSEIAIQEIEEELEAYHRTLVKTRVSLLNALNY